MLFNDSISSGGPIPPLLPLLICQSLFTSPVPDVTLCKQQESQESNHGWIPRALLAAGLHPDQLWAGEGSMAVKQHEGLVHAPTTLVNTACGS